MAIKTFYKQTKKVTYYIDRTQVLNQNLDKNGNF